MGGHASIEARLVGGVCGPLPVPESLRPFPAAAEVAEANELLEGMGGGELTLQPTLTEMLEEGIARLLSPQGTWKLWQWPGCPTDFFSADDFKCAFAGKLCPGCDFLLLCASLGPCLFLSN